MATESLAVMAESLALTLGVETKVRPFQTRSVPLSERVSGSAEERSMGVPLLGWVSEEIDRTHEAGKIEEGQEMGRRTICA